jgi:hypothetical protein
LHHNKLDEFLNAESQKFEQLCYNVFIVSPDGQALWECIKERHLLDNKVDPSSPSANQIAMFDAGFREAMLGLYRFAQNYQAKQLMKVTHDG